MAAETIEETFFGGDTEGCGFLAVKGAAGPEITAPPF